MNIASRREADVTVLELEGRFDAHEVDGFRLVVKGIARPRSVLRLDLSRVRFVDSMALAELMHTRGALLRMGGRLLVAPLSDAVRVILELTGLYAVFIEDPPNGLA